MLFRLPQPLHGWREFVHEVIIVVIGVLLALGGAELVDTLHWKSEASDFSNAVDHELGRNLGIYEVVMKQRPCVTRRLAELERFLADSGRGKQDRLARPIGMPNRYSQYSSVWNNRSPEITANLPGDRRVRYSELYDEFANNDVIRLSEREVWRDLGQYDQPEPLDREDRMRLRSLLNRAEYINEVSAGNYGYIVKLARPLGIRPVGEEDLVVHPGSENFCQPLLAN